MPDTVDTVVIYAGQRRRVVRLLSRSDSTGETNVIKVDKSALTATNGKEPSKLVIEEIEWNVQGFKNVVLTFDHTTDDEAAVLAGAGYKDYRPYGGLVDPASAGGTGDILLSTTGAVADASYDITLTLRLKE